MTLCECGCGEETNIRRGRHNRFILGHNNFGNQNLLGYKHSDETKKKLSEMNRDKISRLRGRKLSEETKIRISEACKGKNLGNQHSLGVKLSSETKRKISEACKGDKHYNWQGGISFEPYCHKFNNSFKESIREKFNRKCFLCNKNEKENGRKLDVHHVQYNKNCGCDDSLKCDYVPLCRKCHAKTNHNRNYWEEIILAKLDLILIQ